ncbi:hypothetical protein [Caulobacter sp. S45]|uniref:hypothetical protein n=1 Tax=Caulobacter sp. S45 TaxID=1641861 RepID=UPI00131D75F4|nr:hypothetical protein [Caulobacter sp. S45]
MAEPSFERHLQRLYAEPPPFADGASFATGVQQRLNRNWALRRGLIGVAGVTGGLIAAAQFVDSNLAERANLASEGASLKLHDMAASVARQTGLQVDVSHILPMGGEAIWLVAGLAALGLALLAARVFETF